MGWGHGDHFLDPGQCFTQDRVTESHSSLPIQRVYNGRKVHVKAQEENFVKKTRLHLALSSN